MPAWEQVDHKRLVEHASNLFFDVPAFWASGTAAGMGGPVFPPASGTVVAGAAAGAATATGCVAADTAAEMGGPVFPPASGASIICRM